MLSLQQPRHIPTLPKELVKPDGAVCPLLIDAVEKGKNELTENFPCDPVETSIWECSGS